MKQGVQLALPWLEVNEPGAHAVHAVLPLAVDAVPAEHRSHVSLPVAD